MDIEWQPQMKTVYLDISTINFRMYIQVLRRLYILLPNVPSCRTTTPGREI